eukprot:TRINITY_DN2483_c0_g3_i1.p1 TRINITY_DN2483_c0_g3~~TRINITY_DN2483_c0_g3_i1.p1  ORF type:complete len:979 (-),score=356.78 TRINITY_DN2483_c0_g3_i1:37-2973(-)
MGVEDVLDIGVNERRFWGLMPLLAILAPLLAGTLLILLGRVLKTIFRLLRKKEEIPTGSQLLKEVKKTLYMQRSHQIKRHSPYSPYSIRTFLSSTTPGTWWNIFQIVITLLSVTFYVVESYYTGSTIIKAKWVIIAEIVIAAIFTLDYLLNFYASEDRLKFFWSVNALVDLLTIIPVIIDLIHNSAFGDDTLKILRSVRVFRLQKAMSLTVSVVAGQALKLIVTFFSLFYVSATIVMVLEMLKFHDALYLITVTFTTVGYGDLSPHTAEGKIIMIVLILISFFVLSYQTSLLISALSEVSPYDSSFHQARNSTRKHVVLMGEFTVSTTKELFREFLHTSHRSLSRLVILAPQEPQGEIQRMLKIPFFQQNVTWLRRSTDIQEDMNRIRVKDAAACFFSIDPFNDNATLVDTDYIMQNIAVKSFSSTLPVYFQVVKSALSSHLRFYPRMQLINYGEMIMSLFGQNCLHNGFSTLIMNLIRTSDAPKVDSVRERERPKWVNEYVRGAANGLRKGRLPPFLIGKKFEEAATFLMARFEVTLIALEVEKERGDKTTVLNPVGYVIRPGDEGFMIAQTDEKVLQITLYRRELDVEFDRFNGEGFRRLMVPLVDFFDDEVTEGELIRLDEMPPASPQIDERSSSSSGRSSTSSGTRERSGSITRPSISTESVLTTGTTSSINDLFLTLKVPNQLETQQISEVTFSNHIVVVGPPDNEYFHLILPLRSTRLSEVSKIVLVHNIQPDEDAWAPLGIFPEVYFLLGDIEHDHQLLNIAKAKTVILFSDPELRKTSTVSQDASTIITIRKLQNMYRNVSIVCEVSQSASGRFFPGSEDIPQFKPKFRWYQGWNPTELLADDDSILNLSSGHIIAPSLIFNSLMCQAYFQPHLVHLIQLLVLGAKPGLDVNSNITLVPIPQNMVDREWDNLFRSMIEEGSVPVAIYRHRSRGKPYVFTNPPPKTVLYSEDRLFVLSNNSLPVTNPTILE